MYGRDASRGGHLGNGPFGLPVRMNFTHVVSWSSTNASSSGVNAWKSGGSPKRKDGSRPRASEAPAVKRVAYGAGVART